MVDFEPAEHFDCRAAELWSEDDALFIKIKYGVQLNLNDV